MHTKEKQRPAALKVSKFWDIDVTCEVSTAHQDSPVTTLEAPAFEGKVLGVNGATDAEKRSNVAHQERYEEHQALLPRLPIPPLQHTCELYLKSLQAIVSPEEYFRAQRQVQEFLEPGGTGELLHNHLLEWEKTCNKPSWIEDFWDDSYLHTRDPIPVNANYFFQLRPHPQQSSGSRRVSQVGRAASLLHAATEYYLSILHGTVAREFERGVPVCMSQYRFLFATSRVPHPRRDRKLCYSTRPLTNDEKKSTFVEYVVANPTHCVVIVCNRYFKVEVVRKDGTQYSFEEVAMSLKEIVNRATSRKEPGAPVGLFTTMNRTDWFYAREHLKKLGNNEILQAIQSAIICLCLDSVEVTSPNEAAKLFLHGLGTNRWFDRHNIIVTRDGTAGVNCEHSVADGTATLRVADFVYQKDCERFLTDEDIDALMETRGGGEVFADTVTELVWSLDEECEDLMKDAFAKFKLLIDSNETTVSYFREFGSLHLKNSGVSPDAFVQTALQLTYYRLYGRNCATYESASTRTFSHGRTDCVRSATCATWDFCRAASNSIFLSHVGSDMPTQRKLLQAALDSHTGYMKLTKKGLGVDRHFYGLRVMARKYCIPEPEIFTSECFHRSATWIMSTSHCGSDGLDAFGFGPVVSSGYGIGYMIRSGSIHFVTTAEHTHPFTSTPVFGSMLHSALMHMDAVLRTGAVNECAGGHTSVFSHACGFNGFELT